MALANQKPVEHFKSMNAPITPAYALGWAEIMSSLDMTASLLAAFMAVRRKTHLLSSKGSSTSVPSNRSITGIHWFFGDPRKLHYPTDMIGHSHIG